MITLMKFLILICFLCIIVMDMFQIGFEIKELIFIMCVALMSSTEGINYCQFSLGYNCYTSKF